MPKLQIQIFNIFNIQILINIFNIHQQIQYPNPNQHIQYPNQPNQYLSINRFIKSKWLKLMSYGLQTKIVKIIPYGLQKYKHNPNINDKNIKLYYSVWYGIDRYQNLDTAIIPYSIGTVRYGTEYLPIPNETV